ncbi:MAG: polymerase epsilon subunit [Dehalococcoidia bacterium]|nr:polymerase epsilon subunit [Dehalococcoidia bacterium]
MLEEVCVSLDVETTGLNAETDDIIEIAAIKFDGGKTIGTFHSLVKPSVPIPYHIQCLTGISPAEVLDAPRLAEIMPGLVSFIGSHALVGHNLSFDLGFLSRRSTALNNPVYDTLELALLLLPGLSHYTLAAVAEHLGCAAPVVHRADADAGISQAVFLALLNRAAGLPPPVVSEIVRLTSFTAWSMLPLFRNIEKANQAAQVPTSVGTGQALESSFAFLSQEAEKVPPKVGTGSSRKALDMDRLTAILEPGGSLEKSWSNYEHRDEQVRMMQAVARALSEGRHLLVEAGTGTGKSLAYLLPACTFALQNNVPVLVSTNTINLQEQLLQKDIPGLRAALGLGTDDLRVTVLKGRSNYLCLRQWDNLRQAQLSPEENRFLLRVLVWLTQTTTGDRSELRIAGPENQVWNKVCSREKDCLGTHCLRQKQGFCFLYQARQRAEEAHLTVINHALLLSDLASGGKTLPQFNHIIIDEAHHLEGQTTEQFGFQISLTELSDYFNTISHHLGGTVFGGLLAEVRNALRTAAPLASERRAVGELTADLQAKTAGAQQQATQLFELLARFVQDQAPARKGNYETQLRLTGACRSQSAWDVLKIVAENVALNLQELVGGLSRLYTALDNLPPPDIPAMDGLLVRLEALAQDGTALQRQINASVFTPEGGYVYWATMKSASGEEKTAVLKAAPLETGAILRDRLFSRKECIILTSATLTVGDDFAFIKGRLGLDTADEMLIGSPFDYRSSTLLFIVQDIPEPDRPGYQAGIEEALMALGVAARGRTLALFTSHSSLRTTLSSLQPALEKEGILALGQGVSGSTWQVLETFKSRPGTILLGTSSFWEGVDVPGDALSVLAIARLPFPVPSDPVNAARSELFDNPFDEYSVPQTVLKFRQGFGRLIRTRTDRGIVVLLDSRVNSRYYGSVFLKSLPSCTVKKGTHRDLARDVKNWLGV